MKEVHFSNKDLYLYLSSFYIPIQDGVLPHFLKCTPEHSESETDRPADDRSVHSGYPNASSVTVWSG